MKEPVIKPNRQIIVTLLVYCLSLGCLSALFISAGRESLLLLLKPDWFFLSCVVGFSLVSIEIMTRRFEYSLKFARLEQSVPHRNLFYGTAFGITSGLFLTDAAGQVLARSVLLKGRQEMSLASGIIGSSIEKSIDVLTSVVLSIPLLLWFILDRNNNSLEVYSLLYLGFGLAWLLAGGYWMPALLKVVRSSARLLHRCLGLVGLAGGKADGTSWIERIAPEEAAKEVKRSQGRSGSYRIMALTLLKNVLQSVRLYFICLAFGIDVPFEILLLGAPVVQFTIIFSFTPGALGIMEVGWLAVFNLIRLPTETALQFLVLLRITGYLIFPLIVLALNPFLKPAPLHLEPGSMER